ncbi:hypothetical protein HOD05_05175 [Candidatus Woesearchaeota archaeon]|jgi:hypothetical protein|nr:hypothetical protein [Candidatus Woesearchaeota archaeon]MBT4151104.1 hypothetical protein [Candidatus Woesearchaeota archaeon]MBT4434578.1 hypothetical protein [Candidatus Woesearchaeota archaeon]MBT7332223.1 hypothetical protein [Candidatus Woesearchaeota archaeon]
MKSTIFVISILLVAVFVAGCAIPDEPIPQMELEEIDDVKEVPKVEEKQESVSLDLESLKSELVEIYPQKDVTWDQNDSYLEANFRKLIVIDSENVLGKEWNGNLHFVDQLELEKLFHPVLMEKFGTDREYRDYKNLEKVIDQKVIENTLKVDEGFVQEYQFLNFEFNNEGYQRGSFIDPLVLYKISCSSEYAIYLQPTRAELITPSSISTREEAYQRWEAHLTKVREGMLIKSNDVLKVCPSQGEFLEDYTTTKTLSYYYPAHLEFFWDFDIAVDSIAVEQATDTDGSTIKGKMMIKKVDLTFTNTEPYDLKGKFLVTVTTESDDGEKETLIDGRTASVSKEVFKSGEVISQSFPSTVKPSFEKYMDVTVKFFDDAYHNAPIDVKTFRVDVNGTVS